MSKRILVLAACVSILVIISGSGCGHEHSTEKFLIWKIIKLPDGSKGVTYKGAADDWAINTLRDDIVCYGTECIDKNATSSDDPGMGDGLIAVQYPPTQQKDRIDFSRISMRQLFPPYMHFSLANMFGWVSIYREINHNDKAISDPVDNEVADQLDAVAYFKLGSVHAQSGRYERAISDYNKAIEMNPKFVEAFNNRGVAYYEKGQGDLAILDYSKAIEVNPRFAQAFYNRGIAYYNKGQNNLAISDYAKAIEINSQLHNQDDMFVRLVRKNWAKFKEIKRS